MIDRNVYNTLENIRIIIHIYIYVYIILSQTRKRHLYQLPFPFAYNGKYIHTDKGRNIGVKWN
jgi:hypothetical protein